MSEIDGVKDVLKRFARAYSAKDVAAILDLYESDRSTIAIGSGADEWNVGVKQIRRQFERDTSQAETLKLKIGASRVQATKDVAWLAARLVAEVGAGGQTIAMAGRFTATLRRRGKTWKFVQTHFSMPFGEQAPGESFPAPGGPAAQPPERATAE